VSDGARMAIRDPELAGWLLASLSSGLVAIDETGAVTALNEAAQRILGTPPGDLDDWLGRDFREVLVERPQLVALLEDALDGRERPSRAELALDPLPGRDAGTIGFTLLPVRDPGGAVRGAAIQFRDLSAFERMDEQERLRDRLAALGEMAAGLAHELRNPLAGMEVVAGLLRRRLRAGSEEEGLLHELRGQLRAMAHTLDQVLEFVRPAAWAPRALDPVALVDEALDRAAARVAFPGKVERRYAPDLPRLHGDPERLLRAVTDVAVNALEAMVACEDGRELRLEVELRCERRPGPLRAVRVGREGLAALGAPAPRTELVLSVADTGPGVPPELRDRIFYPFFTTKGGGTGVGLASAQKAVTGHGGHIEVAERAGGGAVFRLHLPLRSPAE